MQREPREPPQRAVPAIVSVSALAVSLLACADGAREAVLTVPLVATARNAGEIGRAFLISRGAVTDVVVEVSGVPPLIASRPVHLYTYLYEGRCDALPPKSRFALTDRVLAQRAAGAGLPAGGPFTVSNTVPLALDALRRAHHAIAIRTSSADGNVEIFCGNMVGPRSEVGAVQAAAAAGSATQIAAGIQSN